jgi:hypothetical protein
MVIQRRTMEYNRDEIRELQLGFQKAVGVEDNSRKRTGSSLRNFRLQEMARKGLDCAK